ncbi:hypothetical protein ACFL96_19970 [Thermoproteota archaeon]
MHDGSEKEAYQGILDMVKRIVPDTYLRFLLHAKRQYETESQKRIIENINTTYQDIEIERYVEPEPTFHGESLKGVRKRNYCRHMRPWEIMGLFIAHLEGRLEGELDSLAQGLMMGKGEWLSMSVQRKGDLLTCYVDPNNLSWDGWTYSAKNTLSELAYTHERTFNITGIPDKVWVDLERFDDDLVEFLYTQKFDDLPEKMKEEMPQIYLPGDSGIWPMSRKGINGDNFNLSCYDCIMSGASRGARPNPKAL